MTIGGWIIMIASIGSVSVLLVWSIYKIMSTPEEIDHVHGFEFETPDEIADHESRR